MSGSWRAFDPFRTPAFTLFFSGQVVSNVGLWFQNLALSLLVLQESGSAQALSLVTVAQFTPILLLSVPAGWLADRVSPLLILRVSAAASIVIVLSLSIVVSAPEPSLPLVYAHVAAFGTAGAFERIAAQAVIVELVGSARLSRAVAITTIALSAARSIGPGLAGLAFSAFGATACLLAFAACLCVALGLLLVIRRSSLHPRPRRAAPLASDAPTSRRPRNLALLALLSVNIIVAVFALNLMVVITATVTLTFDGDAAAVGAAHAFNALGAVAGGLLAAARPRMTVHVLIPACAAFAAALALNAAAPTLGVFLALAPVLGIAVGFYHGALSAAAQTAVPPERIGRTMSLVTLGSFGMTPLGALLAGAVIDASSGRVALLVGAAACLLCVLGLSIGRWHIRRR
jgi:MFS family permease